MLSPCVSLLPTLHTPLVSIDNVAGRSSHTLVFRDNFQAARYPNRQLMKTTVVIRHNIQQSAMLDTLHNLQIPSSSLSSSSEPSYSSVFTSILHQHHYHHHYHQSSSWSSISSDVIASWHVSPVCWSMMVCKIDCESRLVKFDCVPRYNCASS